MTVKFVSAQDVDRFVSAAFIKRTVNCATSTNSGLEDSSIARIAVVNPEDPGPWRLVHARGSGAAAASPLWGLSALRRLCRIVTKRCGSSGMRRIEDGM
jgi:hypothetical protein